MRALGIAAVALCAWLGPRIAGACRCAVGPLDARAIAEYDVIFEGTTRTAWPRAGGGQRTVIEVHRVWRGEVGARVTVFTVDTNCHFRLASNRRYFVFARRFSDSLVVDDCSHTRISDSASEALAVLGDAVPPSEARCDAGGRRDGWVVILVPLLLGRRRRR